MKGTAHLTCDAGARIGEIGTKSWMIGRGGIADSKTCD
jgi:hypothetical protein